MKKFTLFITLILASFSFSGLAQVTIGDADIVNKRIPIEPFYGYTYSQVIYLQEEIGDAMDIGHLIYYATPETTLATSSEWTVYIGHTTKTQFDNSDDWVEMADLNQVFTGVASASAGVVHIILDDEFNYNGVDNLVIAVDENQSGYDSSTHDFYTTEVLNDRSLSYWSDVTNPDPAAPPTASLIQPFIANITLAPTPTCLWVTDLLADSITADSADLSWVEGGAATAWNVEYGPTGFSIGSGTLVSADAESYALTGLSSSSSYDFYVQADCGGGDVSTWTGPYTFLTTITCPAPDFLSSTGVTANSASLDWIENGAATMWNIQYGESGFTIGSGTEVSTDSNPYVLSGLTASTSYDYYVQSACDVDDYSLWTGPYTFVTLCDAITPYYNQDFTTFIPMCWDVANNGDLITGPTEIGGSPWNSNTVFGDETVRINLYSASHSDWLLSPQFDLSDGGYEVVVSVAVTNWLSADPDEMGSDDAVNLAYTEDGITWNVINTWTVADALPNALTQFSFPMSSVGTAVQFGILATDGPVDDSMDYDFHIDDFKVRIPPTCPEPSALEATNVFATTVDLGWTENGSAASWNIEYGAVGFELGTGTVIVADVNPFTLTGLTSSTEYDFYVQSDCGVDDQSVWIGPSSFLTMVSCPAPTELTVENLGETSADLTWEANGTTAWNIEYGAMGFVQGTGTTIATTENPYTLSGLTDSTSYDYYVQADCGDGDLSLWSGPYSFQTTIVGGSCGVYSIELIDTWGDGWNGGVLDVFVNGVLFYDDLTLDAGTGPEVTEIPVDIDDVISILYTGGSFQSENEYRVFDQLGTMVAEQGAGGTIPNNVGDPAIPSGIAACPACPAPIDLLVSGITSVSADLAWTEYGDATTWNIEYGPSGFVPGAGTLLSGVVDNPFALDGLTPAYTYDVYVQAFCNDDEQSLWAGPVSFDTPPVPAENNDCADAIDVPIDGSIVNATLFASTPSEELPLPGDVCGNIGNGEDVWFTVTATEASNITITTQESSGSTLDDTIMVAYSGTCGTLEEIACNDDYLSGFSSLTVIGVQAGETVYIRVFAYYQSGGTPFDSFQISATFESVVGLDEVLIEGFNMYPNPVEETLNIEAEVSLDEITISDMLGRVILKSYPASMQAQLDMKTLPSGAYIVKAKSGNQIASYNLIKK